MTAPTPPEVEEERVVEEMARAMWNALPATPYGWDGAPEPDRRVWLTLAAAAVTAYRAAQDGGAEEAVRRESALRHQRDTALQSLDIHMDAVDRLHAQVARVEALCDETENRWPDFSPAGDPLPYVVETSAVRTALAPQAER